MRFSTTGEEVMETAMVALPVEQSKTAQTGASRVIARFLPSFADAAFFTPLVILFVALKGAGVLLGDSDTGWHLRAGQWMLQNGRVPDHDIFSFTKAGQPWFAWEWLWDVTFGWMHLQWGLEAVVFASLLVLCVTSLLVYRLALKRCGNPFVALAVTGTAAFASSIHWLARPHLFTLLFVAIFYTVLERVEEGKTRELYWLPALMVLWTNLHGGFVAALVLTGTYAAGSAISAVVERDTEVRRASGMKALRYAACGLACLAASLINPYGYQVHVHIVKYLNDPYFQNSITEFFSLNFGHPAAKYFEMIAALAVLSVVWNLYHRRFAQALLLLSWGHMGLVMVRHMPIFMVLAAPIVSVVLVDLIDWVRRSDVAAWIPRAAEAFLRSGREALEIESIRRIPLLPIGGVLVLLMILNAQASAKFRAEFDPTRYPVAAARMLAAPEFATGVFTTDAWGGYLIYSLYPHKVFFDGRSDFYTSAFDSDYTAVIRARYDWQAKLDKYSVHTVLLPADSPLASTLKAMPDWHPIYDDGMAVVFRRPLNGGAQAPGGARVSAVTDSGINAIVRSQIKTM